MALRLVEMVLKESQSNEIVALLKEHNVLQYREIHLRNEEVSIRILIDAQKNEKVLDLLEEKYAINRDNLAIILPVEATLPRIELDLEAEPAEPERIGREELYLDIKSAARCSRVYLMMTILSTIVAAVGLYHNSVIMIIGAMVIAPSIGPSMALSLATTLGDLPLFRRACLTSFAGVGTTVVLSVIIGAITNLDPTGAEVVSRIRVDLGNVIVALTSGCAGALAFTTGVSAILIGVMVAVALLPPLVTFGMLLGSGHTALALGALSLFLMNIICVNLSGIITFLVQGIHPAGWREKNLAKKATYIAIGLWALLLLILGFLIYLLRSR